MRLLVLCMSALALSAATIPPGTEINVRLGQTLSSEKNRSGDRWDGTLADDLVVNGKRVARRGAPVHGKVVNAESSGRLSHPGKLDLELTSVNGIRVATSEVLEQGGSHKGRNAKAIGGTAAAGAIIGAIAGGGKGAAIGAGAGAGVGTAGAAATGKKDVRIPVETVLTFTVR
jgi:hypothetical protein